LGDLAVREKQTGVVERSSLSVGDVVAHVEKIQQVMKSLMKVGEHYGVIPGTGTKPTLLKAGAEKLSFSFRLLPKFRITKTDLSNAHREYELVCELWHESGVFAGEGVGSCSTMESKYRYRNGAKKCPHCGKETIIKGKEEYGGGWVCFAKKGGCGAKFSDNAPEIVSQPVGKVENPDIADTYNTVLKMAKKRALVDATITACAASDIFTQDVEDSQADDAIPVEHSEPSELTPLQKARNAARDAGNAVNASGLFTEEEMAAKRKMYMDNKDNLPSLEHIAKTWPDEIAARKDAQKSMPSGDEAGAEEAFNK
jgi:hypothetical protein